MASQQYLPTRVPVQLARIVVCLGAVGFAAVGPVAQTTARSVEPKAAAGVAQQFDLRGSNFRGVRLRKVNFAGRDLTGCYMQDADLRDASFWRARLDGVDLRGALGFRAQQLAAAVWSTDNPPRLDAGLNRFRRFWERRRADGSNLAGVNLWGAELSGFNFADADLRGAVFIDAKLRSAVFPRARLKGAIFAGADLTGVDLRGALGLTAGQLVSARWNPKDPPRVGDGLNLILKFFERKKLVGRDLRGARLFGRDLSGADFTNCKLVGAGFLGARLVGAVFREADLTDAVLTGADISGADFRGVRGLTAAGLLSAHWDRESPPALDSQLNLARRMFERRSLSGLDLRGANFWGVDLSGGSFEGSPLADTVFMGANLSGATLVEADLSGAILAGADLSGADLRNAKGLTAGQLLSARWSESKPPKLSRELELFRKMWSKRDLQGYALHGACLWDLGLQGARLHNGDLSDVLFLRTDLRGATFANTRLGGTQFLGADISGVDFRGARNLELKSILSAVWDPAKPPTMDARLNFARHLSEHRRFEFDMDGAALHLVDPKGVMGPPRPSDRFARFGLGTPPHLGLPRLLELLRKRDYQQMRIDR